MLETIAWRLFRIDFWETRPGKWLCRRSHHSCGVWWFNADGLEPDMHCKRCGDDLG